MVCLKHPDVDAVAVCAACGKPVCADCVMVFDNQRYCSRECYCRGSASALRAEQVLGSKKRSDRKSSAGKFLTFVIIIVAAVCAACFYAKNKKVIDRKAAKGIKSIKTHTGRAVEEGKRSVPQNSKYKQNRESMVNQK